MNDYQSPVWRTIANFMRLNGFQYVFASDNAPHQLGTPGMVAWNPFGGEHAVMCLTRTTHVMPRRDINHAVKHFYFWTFEDFMSLFKTGLAPVAEKNDTLFG